MLVKDCMTYHPIMISATTPAAEAQKIMVENKIRHLPVVGDGKRLEGLITRQRLSLKPDEISSLNVWEITRSLSNLTVKTLMIKANDVITITAEKTAERAARIMTENKIGCLPVIEEGTVVTGILSEEDLLIAFQEMLGLPAKGVRVTVRIPEDEKFINLAAVMVENNWGIMGIGSFPSHRNPGFWDIVLKIPHVTCDEVREAIGNIPNHTIVDIRDIV